MQSTPAALSPAAATAAPAASAATPTITGSPAPGASPLASPQATRPAVPLPSLEPGQTITWVKLERPRFAIGEIVVSSFAIVGVAIAVAVGVGMVLGHLRSKRANTHGTGGLGLR